MDALRGLGVDVSYDYTPQQIERLEGFYAASKGLAERIAQRKPVEWLVEGLLPKGCLIVVAGPAKQAAKTLITMALSVAVAEGREFLGRQVNKGAVWYANLEDGAARTGRRFYELGLVEPEKIPIRTICEPEHLLTTIQAADIMRPSPALLVLDPLSECEIEQGVQDENDSREVTLFMRRYRELCQRTGMSIVMIHHFRKSGDMMRGSSALLAGSDGWWDIVPGENGLRFLTWTLRDGSYGEMGVSIEHRPDGGWSVNSASAIEAKPRGRKGTNGTGASRGRPTLDPGQLHSDIAALLKQNEGATMTVKAIREATKARQDRVQFVLEQLAQAGIIERGEGGRGWRWRPGQEGRKSCTESGEVQPDGTKQSPAEEEQV